MILWDCLLGVWGAGKGLEYGIGLYKINQCVILMFKVNVENWMFEIRFSLIWQILIRTEKLL